MGTSASHNGPKSGVSFDPPWLDDIDPSVSGDIDTPPLQNPDKILEVPAVAPRARFSSARRSMGDYIKSGNKHSLAKSLGNYSRTGMGGSKKLASRMHHSAVIASNIYSSFSALREGAESTISGIIDRYKSTGSDVYAFIDAIADAICGNGGSLDEISSKDSVSSALSDLFEEKPSVDIAALSDDDVWSLVSSFLSYEAFTRVQLDVCQGFETKDIPLADRMNRLNDMREYLESEISIQINSLRNELADKPTSDLNSIMSKAIEMTFKVFEDTV